MTKSGQTNDSTRKDGSIFLLKVPCTFTIMTLRVRFQLSQQNFDNNEHGDLVGLCANNTAYGQVRAKFIQDQT